MTIASDRLRAAVRGMLISNFNLDANGCGSPVLNHMGLIATVISG
jgi:hypothetical protein